MAVISSGPIENNPVNGTRPTTQVLVKIINTSAVSAATVLIQGYFLNGSRTLYVLEQINVGANEVVTRNYFANLNAFEYVFTTSEAGAEDTQISMWGRNAAGQLTTSHRLVSEEHLGAE
ncbi:hypothetical protein FZC78_19970 [Rossellomorea vietnamensis]|uniref:Uncharacterized protein n=1 Tax=Rossellomorea vietnamensis TaxID=218284 RepID=A0A5D4NIR0_9BACI|nr:hypothetical protein [Rossellomorea vietnamensis]TYS14123.1 hypothetical protein FZC78_19970 [Rossellomorea vietnamensis]